MHCKIHRGTQEIGGSCVEIWTNETRIVIDIGMPLVEKDGTEFDFSKYKNNTVSELISKSEYDSILKTNEKCQIPPQNTDLGSYIELHGGGVGRDWTWGCIALRDKEMSEVYEFSTEGCDTNIIIYK